MVAQILSANAQLWHSSNNDAIHVPIQLDDTKIIKSTVCVHAASCVWPIDAISTGTRTTLQWNAVEHVSVDNDTFLLLQ